MQTSDWATYYHEPLTLAAIHEHLANMGGFIQVCRRFFAGPRILEIGTGTGILSVYFSQAGYQVTGMDLDPGVLQQNQGVNRQFNGQIRLIQGDMFHLPFATHSFDTIYHQGVLEHFDEPDILAALRIQTTVSKRVIFSVPTNRWTGGVMGNERLWPGSYWKKLLREFRLIHIFSGAYSSLLPRTLHFLERKAPEKVPALLTSANALRNSGEIGFVLER